MTLLYIYILFGSIIIPLLYSIFCVDFIKHWRSFTLSTASIATVFLIWDFFFTKAGVWGFNDSYYLGLKLFEMPIEEWLFFMIIPYCSLFLHYAFYDSFPNLKMNKSTTIILSVFLMILAVGLLFFNSSRSYTVVNFSVFLLILSIGLFLKLELLQNFYVSFLIILIPFFIVNGILTGAFTQEPIVWYNDNENLGVRIHTIPVEDIGYAFSMLFGNVLLFERFNELKQNKKNVSLSQ
jgi:lycopene cyclase domain-containing protein